MIYKGLTKQTLEAEYNLVARRGANSLATLMTQWTLRSALSRDQLKAKLNISYGREPREKLDLFHSGKPNGPLLVYIHGGYWQRGDKHLYSFLADAYVKHGISVAVLNYGLAPKTPIGEIPIQIRRAITWLWKNAADLGFSRDQFHLMGHSAGGHLTAMMLATDWSVYDRELPTEIVTSAIPISGVFELEPLIHTSLNEALELNADKAISISPSQMEIKSTAPQLVIVGANETTEFHRQADEYAQKVSQSARQVFRYDVPKADHFDEITILSDYKSTFFIKTMTLIESTQ